MIFPDRRTLNLFFHPIRLALLLVCAGLCHAGAQTVVLHLKNGDKITGVIVSEYTNHVVLSNSWVKDLSVPLAEIEKRESLIASPGRRSVGTNVLAKLKAEAAPATPPPLFKHWKGTAEVGLDLVYSTADQRNYHGRFTLSYERPYRSNPKNFLRNTLDYDVEYGKTEQKVNGVNTTTTSADSMGASDKTSMDFDKRWYGYNLAGIGYDRVREINFDAEEGPGLGYHVLTNTNLIANVESGVNYQIQYNTDDTHTRDFFFRVAQDLTWKINPRTTFVEKWELYPRVDFSEYRLRGEATISYNLWRYVYLNMTVRDYYDTRPVVGAPPNDLEVHSALGVKF